MKKISSVYWHNLKPFEQFYIQMRQDIDTLTTLKMVIADARKYHPDYNRIYGKGFIELPTGEQYVWSGDTTRKFHEIKLGQIIF